MTTEILKDYIIYKIYCKNKEITEEYYGHTCAFRARKFSHKTKCNNEKDPSYNLQIYQFIRLNGCWDNWEIVPIEELKNCSLVNAKIREQYHIDLNKSKMNKIKAYITEEQIKERDKKNAKEYFLENHDTILEKSKEKYLENRDKISEKNKEKMTCVCGSTFRICAKARHERSQFHCKFIQSAI